MPIGATLAAAGVSAAAGIGGAILQSNAAQKAADAQATASANNLAFQKQIYGTATDQLTPTVNQGVNAGNALSGLLNIGGDPAASQKNFQNYLGSTNYGFLLDQGLKGQSFLNAPNLNSGATAKALGNYAQGQAGNALSGYEGLLAGQQGLGAQSAIGLSGVGTNIAGQSAAANNLAAGAQGTAGLVGASSFGNALNGLNQVFNQYQTQSSFSPSSGFDPNFGSHGSGVPSALQGLV